MYCEIFGRQNRKSPPHRKCACMEKVTEKSVTEQNDKKHLKNVGPIHHCELPHANSPDVASGTVARRLRIAVHDKADNDNA